MSLTQDIQKLICRHELEKGNLVSENFNYYYAGELDVISVTKSGYAYEYEVKVSRADFRADFKKRKWVLFKSKVVDLIPNYFSYVCPENLIKLEELQPYMGLIYIVEDKPIVIRKPKRIHSHKKDPVKLLTKMLTVNNWKHYFGAQKLTIQNRAIQTPGEKSKFIEAVTAIQNRKPNCNGCGTSFVHECDAEGCCVNK